MFCAKWWSSDCEATYDSGITTCYSTPQARKNRVAAFFEPLEPRQLLSGSVVSPDDYTATPIVVAEPLVLPADSGTANDTSLNEDLTPMLAAANASGTGIDWSSLSLTDLFSQASLPDFSSLDLGSEWDALKNAGADIGGLVTNTFEALPQGVTSAISGSTLTGNAAYFSFWSKSINISGDFVGNGSNTFSLITNGDVTVSDVSFVGISSVTIKADSITFGGTTYLGGSLTLSAQGDLTFEGDSKLLAIGNAEHDLNLLCSETLTVGAGVQFRSADGGELAALNDKSATDGIFGVVADSFDAMSLSAPDIVIGSAGAVAIMDAAGAIKVTASLKSGVHPLLALLPVRVAQGEVSIAVNNASITGKSVTMMADVTTTTVADSLSLTELTGNQWMGVVDKLLANSAKDMFNTYLGIDCGMVGGALSFGPLGGVTSPYLSKFNMQLSDMLGEIYKGLQVDAPFLVTYASATSDITIGQGATLISTDGDVTVKATATVSNAQSKNADLFGFVLAINKGNATVSMSGTINSAKDVLIGAVSTNTNSVTLTSTYNPAMDPAAQPSVFKKTATTGTTTTATSAKTKQTYAMGIAVGINEALSKVTVDGTVTAEGDISIKSGTTANIAMNVTANATSSGNLGLALALNFGNSSSRVEVTGMLTAKGGIEGVSNTTVNLTTNSSSNLPSSPAAPATPASAPTTGSTGVTSGVAAVGTQVSDKVSKLMLSLLPMGAVVAPLQEKGVGLGIALGFALNDASADTVVGSSAVVTAQGLVNSGLAGGTGSATFKASSHTTPTMTVASVSNVDPYSYAPSTTQSAGGQPVTVKGVDVVAVAGGAVTTKFISANHGFVVGDKVIYTPSGSSPSLTSFVGGTALQDMVFTVSGVGADYFELSYTPSGAATPTTLKVGALTAEMKSGSHLFTKAAAGAILASSIGANGIIEATGHGLVVGDLVTWKPAVGLSVAGLVDGGVYKVSAASATGFTLTKVDGLPLANTAIALADEGKGWYLVKVTTPADAISAVAGATAPTTSLAAVGADGLIKATGHGLASGDYVSYSTLGSGTTPLTGLTSGSTYKVLVVDANTFKLLNADNVAMTFASMTSAMKQGVHVFTRAAAPSGATAPASVTVAADDIGSAMITAQHSFVVGDVLKYTSSTPATGLAQGMTYKVSGVGTGWFKLTDLNGTAVTMNAVSGTHTFTKTTDPLAQPTVTVTDANVAAGRISVANTFAVGDKVTYTTAGTAFTGLTSGTAYTVASASATYFTLKNASGAVITVATCGTAAQQHSFTKAAPTVAPVVVTVHGSQVNAANGHFNATAIPFRVNDSVVYTVAAGGTALTGLTVGVTYTVAEVGTGYFRLKDANGNVVTITKSAAAGSSTHLFTKGVRNTATQKLTGVNIALGIGQLTNTATATVANEARIVTRNLLDVSADARFLTKTGFTSPLIGRDNTQSSSTGSLDFLSLDFLSDMGAQISGVTGSIDSAYLGAVNEVNGFLGVEALNPKASSLNFLNPSSYVYASTVGAKESAVAASVAYIGQSNTATASIGEGAFIVKTGGLADSAANAETDVVTLADGLYNPAEQGHYVTYMVENGATALNGLTAGTTYWGEVGAGNTSLTLYALDAAGAKGTKIDLAPIAAANLGSVHHFLFNSVNQSTSATSASVTAVSDHNVLEFEEAHGFSTGQLVTYSKGEDTNAAIGGLTDGGSYLVFVTGLNNFSLKSVNLATGVIGADFVTFDASSATGDGHAFVAMTDAQRTGLNQSFSTSSFAANNAKSSNLFSGFSTGDKLVYRTTGAALDGLINGATYMLSVMGTNSFALYAADGTAIIFASSDSADSARHTFTRAAAGSVPEKSFSFEGSELSLSALDTKNSDGDPETLTVAALGTFTNTISLAADNHLLLRNGDIVTYEASGTALSGLVDGTDYMVTVAESGTFSLRAVDGEGEAYGDFIQIDTRTTGLMSTDTHSFTVKTPVTWSAITLDAAAVAVDGTVFYVGGHDFQTGDVVELKSLLKDADGTVYMDAAGNLQYGSRGRYTVVRVSEAALKLWDATLDEFISVPAGQISGYDDFTLTRVTAGSVFAADAADGGALKVMNGSFGVGDAVVFQALEGGASGLVSGQTYYVTGVNGHADEGTDTITLSASTGGAAIAVSLDADGLYSLSLATERRITLQGTAGVLTLGSDSGLYDGAVVRFEGEGGAALISGTDYYLGRTVSGGTETYYLAAGYEDYLAGKYLDLSGAIIDGSLSLSADAHVFSQETLNVGQSIIFIDEAHGLLDGDMVTIEHGNDAYYYSVTTFGEKAFALTLIKTEIASVLADGTDGGFATRESLLLTGETGATLLRSLQAVVFDAASADSLSLGAPTITKAAHGYVTGMELTAKWTEGTDAKTAVVYVIAIDADTFMLADSLSEAQQGVASRSFKDQTVTLDRAAQQYGVSVNAITEDRTVHVAGKMDTGKGAIKTGLPQRSNLSNALNPTAALKNKLMPQRAPASQSGAGATLQVVNVQNTTHATIGAGTTIVADSLAVTAKTGNGLLTLVQAGAGGQKEGISGVLSAFIMDNDTLAELYVNSASIALGNRAAIGSPLGDSLYISALDSSIFTQLALSKSTGESAMGGTVFAQIVDRDTVSGIIGSKIGAADFAGGVSVMGTASITALTTGHGVAFLIGGNVASPAQQDVATTTPPTGSTTGTGGATSGAASGVTSATSTMDSISTALNTLFQTTDGISNLTNQDSEKKNTTDASGLSQAQKESGTITTALTGALTQAGTLSSSMNQGTTNTGTAGQPAQTTDSVPPVNTAYTAEVFAGYVSEATRAVVENLKYLVVAGFVASALDDTRQFTVAGALALTTGQGDAQSKAGSGTFGLNITTRDTDAHVADVDAMTVRQLSGATGDMSITAKDDGLSVMVGAGVAGSTQGAGYGGTLLFNLRLSDTTAYLADTDLTLSKGALNVEAMQDATLITVAGGGGFGASKGVGLSLGVNILDGDTSALIQDCNLSVAGDVGVRAIKGVDKSALNDALTGGTSTLTDMPSGYNLISIGASAGIAKSGDSLAGVLVVNSVTGDTTAGIINTASTRKTLDASGTIVVQSIDQFGILAIGGSLGYSGKQQAAAGTTTPTDPATKQTSSSVGGAAVVNILSTTSSATIVGMNIGSAGEATGAVTVEALSGQQILAIAGAVAAAPGGDATAVTVAANVITAGAAALFDNSDIYAESLRVHAANSAGILAIAGGVGVSAGNNTAAAVAVNVIAGAALPAIGPDTKAENITQLTGTESGSVDVSARVLNANLYLGAGGLDVLAEASSAILSIAAGIGVSTGSDAQSPSTSNVAGAATVNIIARTVTALVDNSLIDSVGKASIITDDTSRILAIAGGVGVNAKGSQAGAAVGVNVITSKVSAALTGSQVDEAGGLEILAGSSAKILGVTASVAIAKDETRASAKSASLAVNVISKSVTASMTGRDATTQQDVTGDLVVRATDRSEILSLSAAVAAAMAADASTLGGALAVNVITSDVLAKISAATVRATGSITVEAKGENSILAINLALAGTGAVLNPNVIVSNVKTEISSADLEAVGNFTATATQAAPGSTTTASWLDGVKGDTGSDSASSVDKYLDTAGADFKSSILSISLTLGFSNSATTSALGALVAVNVITASVDVALTASKIDAGGAFVASAANGAVIRAITMGVAVSTGANAGQAGLAFNTAVMQTKVRAENSTLSSGSGMGLAALSNADILAIALNAAVSTTGKAGGLFLSVNVITSETLATIAGTTQTVDVGGALTLTAEDRAIIRAITVAASVGSSGAVGLANNTSVIVGTVKAGINGMASVEAGEDVSVRALSSSQILSIAVGASVGMTSAESGAVAQATLSENVLVRDVDAYLTGIGVMTVGGDLLIDAQDAYTATGSDWRDAKWAQGIDLDDVDSAKAGYDPNADLFAPKGGIFALTVAVAASAGSGTVAAGVLTFNWLERKVNATMDGVKLRMTGTKPGLADGKGSVTVNAFSASSAFAGLLSVAGGAGGNAAAVAGAVNVLDNQTRALVSNSTVAGWVVGSGIVDAKLGAVSVTSTSLSGAGALVVSVAASAGSGTNAGTTAIAGTLSLNLGVGASGQASATPPSGSASASDLKSGLDSRRDAVVSMGQNAMADDGLIGKRMGTGAPLPSASVGGEAAQADIEHSVISGSGLVDVVAVQQSSMTSINLSVAIKAGGSSGNNAFAAVISANVLAANAISAVNDSTITAGGLAVRSSGQSDIKALNISAAVSAGSGSSMAVSGNLGVNVIVRDVSATAGSTDTTRDTYLLGSQGLTVTAADTSRIMALGFTLSIASGASATAIGGTVGVNVIVTEQTAGISNVDVTSSGTVLVKATSGNTIQSLTIGVSGISAALMPNVIASKTLAMVSDSDITTSVGDIMVQAMQTAANDSGAAALLASAAGTGSSSDQGTLNDFLSTSGCDFASNILALSLNVGVSAGGSSAAVAGAAAVNVIVSKVDATVVDAVLQAAGALDMKAVNSSIIRAIGMGAAVSTDKTSVNGSLSSNTVVNSATATSTDSSLRSVGDMSLAAWNQTSILALAINASVSLGGVAVGAFLGVNVIDTTTLATVTGTTHTLSAGGDLLLDAQDKANITAISIAASVSTGSAAVGVANNTSVIVGTVKAGTSGLASVDVDGDTTAQALATSQIVSIAVGVAASAASVGVQATLSENVIVRTVDAYLTSIGTMTVGGSVVVQAHEAAPSLTGDWRNQSWAAGVGLSDVDSSQFNSSDVKSENGGRSMGSGGDYDPNAALFNPAGGIFALTVAIAAGSTAGVAAAFNLNWIERTVEARIDNVVMHVTGGGSVLVDAQSASSAFGGVLAIGAAGTAGVAGAVAVNVLDNQTKAIITGSSIQGWVSGAADASKLGNVIVTAQTVSSAIALTVAVGAGGTAGVGATASLNIGMGAAKQSMTGSTAKDRLASLDSGDQGATIAADTAANGTGSYTSGTSDIPNLGGESAQASVETSTVTGSGNMHVGAVQNSFLLSINLSVGAAGTVGAAAAVGLNLLTAQAQAVVQGSTVQMGSALVHSSVSGKAWSYLVAVGAGGVVGASGLVSVSRIAGNSLATVSGGSMRLTGTPGDTFDPTAALNPSSNPQGLAVVAKGATEMITVGISIGAGGTAGASGAVALALAGNTVKSVIANAGISFDHGGRLTSYAKDSTGVFTTALSVAGAGVGAGAGAIAINLGTWSDMQGYDPSNGANSNLSSPDEQMTAVGSRSNAAGFLTQALVDVTSLLGAGSVSVRALASSTYVAALVVVAGAGAGAGAGGMTLNILDAQVEAALDARGAVHAGNTVINATNSTIMSATMVAGSGAGAGAGAGSLAMNVANIASTARLSGSRDVTLALGDVDVSSTSAAVVAATALAISGAGGGAGVGSVAVNAVINPTEADILLAGSSVLSDSFTLNAGAVTTHAANSSTLVASTLGLTGAGGGAGGLSVSVNVASKGALADMASNLTAVSDKSQTLTGIADNTNASATISGESLTLKNADGSNLSLGTSGVTKEIHYLIYTDAQGEQSVFSFNRSAVVDGGIRLSGLSHVSGSKTVIQTGDAVTYRSSEHGEPTLVTAVMPTVASSSTRMDRVHLNATSLSMLAESNRLAVTVAAGVAGAGGGAGYGSIVTTVGDNRTQALVTNSVITTSGDVNVKALNTTQSFAIASTIAGAGGGAGGAAVAVTTDNGDTEASIRGGSVTANDVFVLANNSLNVFSLTFAAAGAGGFALGGSVAVTVMEGDTTALMDSVGVTATGNVSVLASFAKPASGVNLAAISTGNAGTDSFLDGSQTQIAAAQADANSGKDRSDANVTSDRTTDFSDSFTPGGILAISTAVAVSGGAAISGTLAVNVIEGEVAATIHNGSVAATGDVLVSALMNTAIQCYVAGASVSGGVGLAGSMAVNVISGTVLAKVDSLSTLTADDLDVAATQTSTITGLVGQLAGGGLAVGFGLVTNVITGSATALLQNTSVSANTAEIKATRNNTIYGYSFGAAVAGLAAFGGGFVINVLNGDTTASILNSAVDMKGSGTASVLAQDTTRATTLAVQVAASIGGAVSFGSAVTVARADVAALVRNSTISNAASFTAQAISNAALTLRTIGVAVGGVAGGAMVSVAHLTNTVRARVEDSVLSSVGSATVEAAGLWDVYAYSLAGSAGILGAMSGSVATAHIGATVDASMSDSTLTSVGAVSVQAKGTPKAVAIATAPAVSMLFGIGLAVAVADISPIIHARMDGMTITGMAPDVVIAARLLRPSSGDTALARAFALGLGGVFGVGGGAGKVVGRADVRAWWELGSNILHVKSLGITAHSAVRLDALGTGIGVGGLAGAGVADATVAHNSTTLAFVTAGTGLIVDNALAVHAVADIVAAQSSTAGAGALGVAVAATTSSMTVSSTAKSGLGVNWHDSSAASGADITAGTVDARALNAVDFSQSVDGISGSLISGAGASALSIITSVAEVHVGEGTSLTGGRILLYSDNDITGRVSVDSTSVGALAVNAGKGNMTVNSTSRIVIGAAAEVLATDRDLAVAEANGRPAATNRPLVMEAFNHLDLREEVTFNTGAIVGVPIVAGIIDTATVADVNVGPNAKVRTSSNLGGSMLLQSGSEESIELAVASSVYGLASAGSVKGAMTPVTRNTITLNNGSELYGTADVILVAGYGGFENVTPENASYASDGTVLSRIGNAVYNVGADIYDRTAVPLSFASGGLFLTLDNLVNVNGGAVVKSRGDVELIARRSDTSEKSVIQAHNWVNALEGPALTDYSKRERNITQKATVAGTVLAGVDNVVDVTVNKLTWEWWQANKATLSTAERTRIESALTSLQSIGFNDAQLESLLRGTIASTEFYAVISANYADPSTLNWSQWYTNAKALLAENSTALNSGEQAAFEYLKSVDFNYAALSGSDVAATIKDVLSLFDVNKVSLTLWRDILAAGSRTDGSPTLSDAQKFALQTLIDGMDGNGAAYSLNDMSNLRTTFDSMVHNPARLTTAGWQGFDQTGWSAAEKDAYEALEGKSFDFSQITPAQQDVLRAKVEALESDSLWSDWAAKSAYFASSTGAEGLLFSYPSSVYTSLQDVFESFNQLSHLDELAAFIPAVVWNDLGQASGADQYLRNGALSEDQVRAVTTWRLAGCSEAGLTASGATFTSFLNDYAQRTILNSDEFKLDAILETLSYVLTGTGADMVSAEFSTFGKQSGNPQVAEYTQLRKLYSTFGEDAAPSDQIRLRMTELEARLVALDQGAYETVGGKTTFTLKEPASQRLLSVGNVALRRGNVTLYADSVDATGGNVTADGNAVISIKGDGPFALGTNDLSIQSSSGGRIYMLTNTVAGWENLHEGDASTTPSITVRQSTAQPLYIIGEISNLAGSVTLHSQGDLFIYGTVNASHMDVSSMGTLTISLLDSFYSVSGQPLTVGNGTTGNRAVITQQVQGKLQAIGDVRIDAMFININGLIQSGVKQWTVNVGGGSSSATTFNADGSASLGYTYNAAANTYVMDDLMATGGNVYLKGVILNTNAGLGAVKVYTNPDININNATTSALQLGSLDTGSTQTGTINIWNGSAYVEKSGDFYTPTSSYKYHYLTANQTGVVEQYMYCTKTFLGADWLAKDESSYSLQSRVVKNDEPLMGAGFISLLSANGAADMAYNDADKSGTVLIFNVNTTNGVSYQIVTYTRILDESVSTWTDYGESGFWPLKEKRYYNYKTRLSGLLVKLLKQKSIENN